MVKVMVPKIAVAVYEEDVDVHTLAFSEGEDEEDFGVFLMWSEDLEEPYQVVDPLGPAFDEGLVAVRAVAEGVLLELSPSAADFFETTSVLLKGSSSQRDGWMRLLNEFFDRVDPMERPELHALDV